MEQQQPKTLWQVVKGYFNVMPDKEDEADTVSQISSGVTFHGANLWVLIFAIFIASLGLNVNSTAVIIGAMLISPLMGSAIWNCSSGRPRTILSPPSSVCSRLQSISC